MLLPKDIKIHTEKGFDQWGGGGGEEDHGRGIKKLKVWLNIPKGYYTLYGK